MRIESTTASDSQITELSQKSSDATTRSASEKSVRTAATTTTASELLESSSKPTLLNRLSDILWREPTHNCRQTLTAEATSDNSIKVKTDDGYSISFSGSSQEWTITSPDNETTRIWGDPHVEEKSTGRSWDFFDTSSFSFGDNKITVETKDLGNGTSYSKTVTIYSGNQRFTVTGIDDNHLEVQGFGFDGTTHDASLEDGDLYSWAAQNGKETWVKQS